MHCPHGKRVIIDAYVRHSGGEPCSILDKIGVSYWEIDIPDIEQDRLREHGRAVISTPTEEVDKVLKRFFDEERKMNLGGNP